MRSKASWVMTTASQSPVAHRATNSLRASAAVASLVATRMLASGIGLEELGAELLQHVVRDHVGRLGDETESLHLHAGHDHGGGLAGPDGVAEQDRRLLHGPPGGVQLVGWGLKADDRPGKDLMAAVPGGQHDGVEQLVVAGGQPRGALRVLPHPCGEAIGECLLLLSGQQGRLRVEDPPAVPSES